MNRTHNLSEQVYLAFHDWRARLDNDLDRLRTDYLQSLQKDIQQVLAHIERELAIRQRADRAEQLEQLEHTTPLPAHEIQDEAEAASKAYVTEGGHA